MKRPEEMSLVESLVNLIEIPKGITITFGRLIRNFSLHLFHQIGLLKNTAASASIQYPNDRRAYPERYRGRHRLTLYPSGDVRCTSCFLCSTACPAKCIYIEAAEHEDPQVEKFPKRYEIDTLLCIYCGYCVEACPVDAIRMDTGLHPEIYSADPRDFIEDKEVLMQRSRDIETKGIDVLFKEHMQKVQNLEK